MFKQIASSTWCQLVNETVLNRSIFYYNYNFLLQQQFFCYCFRTFSFDSYCASPEMKCQIFVFVLLTFVDVVISTILVCWSKPCISCVNNLIYLAFPAKGTEWNFTSIYCYCAAAVAAPWRGIPKSWKYLIWLKKSIRTSTNLWTYRKRLQIMRLNVPSVHSLLSYIRTKIHPKMPTYNFVTWFPSTKCWRRRRNARSIIKFCVRACQIGSLLYITIGVCVRLVSTKERQYFSSLLLLVSICLRGLLIWKRNILP